MLFLFQASPLRSRIPSESIFCLGGHHEPWGKETAPHQFFSIECSWLEVIVLSFRDFSFSAIFPSVEKYKGPSPSPFLQPQNTFSSFDQLQDQIILETNFTDIYKYELEKKAPVENYSAT